jgi:hypothetical protein
MKNILTGRIEHLNFEYEKTNRNTWTIYITHYNITLKKSAGSNIRDAICRQSCIFLLIHNKSKLLGPWCKISELRTMIYYCYIRCLQLKKEKKSPNLFNASTQLWSVRGVPLFCSFRKSKNKIWGRSRQPLPPWLRPSFSLSLSTGASRTIPLV